MDTKQTFIEKLKKIKQTSRKDHTAIIQVKVPLELRERLSKKLEADKLTVKDLIISAIECYLEENL